MFAGRKGGSSSFKQTPDNLRSNDTFEGVLGLGIGPFKGPKRGLKSIKVDGTAIENETGQQNFQDFAATMGDGDPLKFPQRVQLKLGAGAAPTQVGLSLPNEGGGNPIWITKTLNNTNADFVDLRFIAQQLFRQDAKGIYNATATIEIQMKPVGSTTWVNPTLGTATGTYNEQGYDYDDGFGGLLRALLPQAYYQSQSSNYPITGKTSSPSVYELRISLPSKGVYANTAWDIRARLLERESYVGGKDNADQEKRTISWESMAAVYSTVLGEHEDWRGVAWMQLYGKASDQLTGVPEITGEYDTKIISVPAGVFNPDTRQYTGGVWDGSWAKAFTNDPAWVINDAISDELAGISLIAPGSYLNKWDALDLSKWCSELVPDGNGGTHPRYSLNLAISQPQKAEELVRYLAGAVGALAWDQGDGEWRVKVDKADAPVDLFTLDNIENEFIYSHTDVDTRHNDIIGQFKNAEMDYRADAVQLYDNPSIALLGRKPTTIALVGCTNRQEALRRVKLRLRATVNENRIVTFTTNRRGRNIEQLSTILVADGDLGDMDKRTTGRTISVAPDRLSIEVRDPMYVAPGVVYTMRFTVPNPTYTPETATQPVSADWTKPTVVLSRNVTNTSGQRGAVTTIYLDEALPASIADNLSVALEATNLPTLPRLFRVTSVVPADDGERISISAINIDTGKWAASDNVTKQDTVFQDLRGEVQAPLVIPGAQLVSLIRVPIEQGEQINLQANWMRPAGAFISGFRVRYAVNGGALQTAVERQQLTTWELPNAGPGTYTVEICTIDRRGGYSQPLVGTLEVTQALIDATQIAYTGGETLEDLKPGEAGANVTETRTSADTSAVASRPSTTVIADVDKAKGDSAQALTKIEDVRVDIDELHEIYGDTYSAAQSADAAQTAANNAATALSGGQAARDAAAAAKAGADAARTGAETARDASQMAKGLAESANTSAQAAKTAAESAKQQASDAAAGALASQGAAATSASTASGYKDEAASSASAAQASLTAAQTARDTAKGYSDAAASSASGASTSADTASQKASAAQTSATNAATAAGNANTYAGNAQTSATNAASSASDALGSKNAAAISAGAAATSESRAGGSATAAGNSATAASTSATNAGNSATAASQSEVTAKTSAANMAPSDFREGGRYFIANYQGSQADYPLIVGNGWTFPIVSGQGVVAQTTTLAQGNPLGYTPSRQLSQLAGLALQPGHKYRATVTIRVSANPNGDTQTMQFFWLANQSDGNHINSIKPADFNIPAPNNFYTQVYEISGDALIAAAPSINPNVTATVIKPFLRLQGSNGTTWQVAILKIEDVTSELAAAGSASSAASSASTADASKTAAGQSASAAQTSATNASTSAGNALTYSNNAAGSATNAAGSATTAQQQAGIATTAKNDAQNARDAAAGSASSAAGSASTATSKASEAGQSATSASTSANTASTKAGEAAGSASAAAGSASAASSSSSAAAQSASSAASSELTAKIGVRETLPSDFREAGRYFMAHFEGPPENVPLNAATGWSFVNTDEGQVAQTTPTYHDASYSNYPRQVAPAGAGLKVEAGRHYRATYKIKVTDNPSQGRQYVRFYFLGQAALNNQLLIGFNNNDYGVPNQGIWYTQTVEINANTMLAGNANIRFVKPFIRLVGPDGATWQVALLKIEDITSEAAAAGSASAAATSASAASGSATTAGQQAGAAQTSATNAATSASNANTYSGNAATSASQASTSASNAAGSANTASTAATNAATARDQAGGSASAAAGSASSAAGSATAAGSSATAAASSSLSAAAAAGNLAPATFQEGGRYFMSWFAGAQLNYPVSAATGWSFPTVGGQGTVARTVTGADPASGYDVTRQLTQVTGLPLKPNRRYRATYTVACPNNPSGGTQRVQFYWLGQGADPASHQGSIVAPIYNIPGVGPYYTQVLELNSNDLISATNGNAAYIKPFVRIIGNSGSTIDFSLLRIEDMTGEANASAQASAAASSAASASASVAVATQQATLSASVAAGLSNYNATFQYWPDGLPVPPGFNDGEGGGGGSRVDGVTAGTYGWRLTAAPHANCFGLFTDAAQLIYNGNWIVLEADIRLDAGTLNGAAFQASNANSPNNAIAFAIDKDSTDTVVGAGVVGRTYRFKKVIKLAGTFGSNCYLVNKFTGTNAYGRLDEGNTITWLRAGVRAANSQEINSGKAGDISSRVSNVEGVAATAAGRTEAYSQKEVVAGGASAFISFRAKDDNGNYTSDVAIGASTFSLFNTSGGGWKLAMQMAGGNAVFTGGLQAGAFIRLGSGAGWPVALAQRDFLVADDTYIDFGTNLTNVPDFSFARNNFMPITATQTYQVYIENPTPTGGTLRAKIITPGTPTNVNLTDDAAGGGPTRIMEKGSNGDSTDGVYSLSITGTVTGYAYSVNNNNMCVWTQAWLPGGWQMKDAYLGRDLILLDGEDTLSDGEVKRLRFTTAPCVTITSASGITLTCSTTTPIDWRDGSSGFVIDALGREMAVMDDDGFRWEEIISIVNAGELPIAVMSAGERTYAAGNEPGRYIFTHNQYFKP